MKIKNNSVMVSFRMPIEDYAMLLLLGDKMFRTPNVSKTIKRILSAFIYSNKKEIEEDENL